MLIGLSKVLFFSHKFKALSIALAGMLAVIAILYPREISSKKLTAVAQVRSDFNWLNRELNQQIEQLKDFFVTHDNLDAQCTEQTLLELRKAHFKIPNIAEMGIMNPEGELVCTSWKKLEQPIRTAGPKPPKTSELRFFGPIHTSFVGESALVIAKTRSDGYEINALLPQSILHHQLEDLDRPYNYIVIADSHSGVPISKIGQYSLPITEPLFPISMPLMLKGSTFDDGEAHLLVAEPLADLPSLSLIMAIDEEKLYRHVYIPSLSSLLIYAITFVLLFLLARSYQKYYQSRKSHLKDAISQGQITNFYQLIWDTKSKRFASAETLVRLNDPVEGMLTPNFFLADIEASDLLKEMTYKIIHSLIQDADILTKQLNIEKVNINITGEHLKDAHFKTLILKLNQLIPVLVLELTENELVELDNQHVIQAINDFKAQGILLAIDDFGTGYAGLQYLKSLPLDIIKIDQSYVAAIGTESQLATMLDALIELAKTFKIDVVAEGVETQAQADYLVDKGVYLHQGWKYHKACLLSDI
ncbi:hypothetical protein C1E23_13380 [Pseudoalteromonas phenolica]|uniref:EAL domain-containing protein n=1 Tax=Pseudoalteromonas phenolica TaxID=161398 RepID=A0A4V2EJJ7_9GAMM|nr:EAL domain-containing protein [Pseudoalteromonas phenolica]RZQ52588.1 hypothetical protein C1E23_13380 [Pseudoalteromonas phenolica]